MKASIFKQHGGPEVLEYTDVPEPRIRANEVLVEVKACALNHLDIFVRNGLPRHTPSTEKFRRNPVRSNFAAKRSPPSTVAAISCSVAPRSAALSRACG